MSNLPELKKQWLDKYYDGEFGDGKDMWQWIVTQLIPQIQKEERGKLFDTCAELHQQLFDIRNAAGQDAMVLDEQMRGIRMVKDKISHLQKEAK